MPANSPCEDFGRFRPHSNDMDDENHRNILKLADTEEKRAKVTKICETSVYSTIIMKSQIHITGAMLAFNWLQT